MSKHTLGPWVAKPVQCGSLQYWSIQEKQYNGFEIASTANAEVNEDEANAKLIVAAPELLDTCKWVLGCLTNMPKSDDARSAIRELEAVIAKAEGGGK